MMIREQIMNILMKGSTFKELSSLYEKIYNEPPPEGVAKKFIVKSIIDDPKLPELLNPTEPEPEPLITLDPEPEPEPEPEPSHSLIDDCIPVNEIVENVIQVVEPEPEDDFDIDDTPHEKVPGTNVFYWTEPKDIIKVRMNTGSLLCPGHYRQIRQGELVNKFWNKLRNKYNITGRTEIYVETDPITWEPNTALKYKEEHLDPDLNPNLHPFGNIHITKTNF